MVWHYEFCSGSIKTDYGESGMKQLVIVGAGGFGRECLQIAKDMIRQAQLVREGICVEDFGTNEERRRQSLDAANWEIKGFLDDNPMALEGVDPGYSVISGISEYQMEPEDIFVCAIASNRIKQKVMTQLAKRGAVFVNLFHPKALVADTARFGIGNVMYPFSILSDHTSMGDFVTLNMHSVLGHDAKVADYVTISSFCDITGGVVLEQGVFLGSHSSIVPGIKVSEWAYVCAGSTVMTRVKANTKVLGTPAKRFLI